MISCVKSSTATTILKTHSNIHTQTQIFKNIINIRLYINIHIHITPLNDYLNHTHINIHK